MLGRKWSFVRIETPTVRWKCRKWQRLNRAVPQTSAPKYREFCLKLDSGAQYQTVSNSGPLLWHNFGWQPHAQDQLQQ